jgi:site-specific DNA-adenine methylase
MEDIERLLSGMNYIGGKARQSNLILKYIPNEIESICEPMAGTGEITYAFIKKNPENQLQKIYLNDINPVALSLLKLRFRKTSINETELNDFIESIEPQEGYLFNSDRKTVSDIHKKWIDGMCLSAKTDWQKGFVARCLMSTKTNFDMPHYSKGFESGINFKTFMNNKRDEILKYESMPKDVEIIISSEDILDYSFPECNLIYFDPPYKMLDKSEMNYSKEYNFINSIFKQKDFKDEISFDTNKIKELIPKMKKKCNVLLISAHGGSKNYFAISDKCKTISYEYISGFNNIHSDSKPTKQEKLYILSSDIELSEEINEDINFETIKKLDKAVTEGIRVTTNYGQGIIAGEIKAMLLLLKHPVDNYYLLVEGNYGLGYIKFFEPLEVTEQDLIDNNLMNIGMSKETINIIFGDGIKDFWLYEIEDFILLPEPKNLSMNYEIVLSFNYKEEIEKINKGKEIIFDDIELYDFELTSITSPQVIIPKKIKKEIDKWNSLTNKEIQDMKSEDFPKNYFSIRLHWALGIHIDFLTKINGDLEGMTIACIQKGMTPKDKTMQNLKDLSNKIDDDKYFKFTPDMKGESHVLAIPKINEPLESLKLIDDDNKEGLFYGIDCGLLWCGTQKDYFKEYFLYGKLFYGKRLIFSQITTGDGKKIWNTWISDNEIPYLLTRKGRIANDYVPPEGESGISPDWENIIPDDMKWWVDKLTDKEIKDKMNQAYNWWIENKYLTGNLIKPEGGK